ncbi:hypothetical protein AKJ09_06283 [Labilithrix luteola]|uniref:Uncharacterized protein n=1 Tax=Labilithrix luteola TaxID=1391654 RepID=A0A0K1Q2K6_9BACT|nr:hypothetical protein [Labilithrix luteola]AKU99619.1 hypothetical protein AKJ09_06283 [Labilithrix luteola]
MTNLRRLAALLAACAVGLFGPDLHAAGSNGVDEHTRRIAARTAVGLAALSALGLVLVVGRLRMQAAVESADRELERDFETRLHERDKP